jgi:hypothetical protein
MTENVTVREPEVEQDQPTEDQPDRQPIRTADRAGQAAPATPDAVTTADMAAAGDRAAGAPSTSQPDAAPPASQPDAAPSASQPAAAQARQSAAAQAEAEAVPEAPKAEARAATETEAEATSEAAASLFPAEQSSGYRSRWQEIQTGFVDEPRAAVQEADSLVAEMMRQLARTFADERRQLEAQWSEGEEISTEDLRLALRRYRSFFDRLLSV